MDEVHNSKLFDEAPMDHALHIYHNYFIHEGIVPGYPASHGCIRLFPLDARFLFYQWAKPGIPGKIIDSVRRKEVNFPRSLARETPVRSELEVPGSEESFFLITYAICYAQGDGKGGFEMATKKKIKPWLGAKAFFY